MTHNQSSSKCICSQHVNLFKTSSRLWNILYDKPNNEIFRTNKKKVQYRVWVAISAIEGSSRAYDELGLLSLIKRHDGAIM